MAHLECVFTLFHGRTAAVIMCLAMISCSSDGALPMITGPASPTTATLRGRCISYCPNGSLSCQEYRGTWPQNILVERAAACMQLGVVDACTLGWADGMGGMGPTCQEQTGVLLGGCVKTENQHSLVTWIFRGGNQQNSGDVRRLCTELGEQYLPPPTAVPEATSCDAGMLCTGRCVDTQRDSTNCGTCRRICGGGSQSIPCSNGQCEIGAWCSSGPVECRFGDNTYVVCTSSSVDNCGFCGGRCFPRETCREGLCCEDATHCRTASR